MVTAPPRGRRVSMSMSRLGWPKHSRWVGGGYTADFFSSPSLGLHVKNVLRFGATNIIPTQGADLLTNGLEITLRLLNTWVCFCQLAWTPSRPEMCLLNTAHAQRQQRTDSAFKANVKQCKRRDTTPPTCLKLKLSPVPQTTSLTQCLSEKQ